MKLFLEKDIRTRKLKKYSIYAVAFVLLAVAQIALIDLIAVEGLTPDLILILCVWVALSEGKFEGMIAAFIFGLLFDVFSMDVLGSNALAKTTAALAAGFFFNENKIEQNLGGYKFLIIVFVASIVHNLIYFFLYIKFSQLSFFPFFFKYGLAISFYTTVVAIIPMLLKIPKNKLLR